jgi:CubicO group peptidase (beta-lactamase class C family)
MFKSNGGTKEPELSLKQQGRRSVMLGSGKVAAMGAVVATLGSRMSREADAAAPTDALVDIKRGNGLREDQLLSLKSQIEEDISRGRYYGAVVLVARHGAVGIHEAIGYTNDKDRQAIAKDSVFTLFSTTKGLTDFLVYRAIEKGQFALTTKVSEIIPAFDGPSRKDITFYHLLTHSSGLSPVFTPKAGMPIDHLEEVIDAICKYVQSIERPGELVTYAPMAGQALMGWATHLTDPQKRSYRQLVNDEILTPLKMKDTSIGVRADLKDRHIFPVFMDKAAGQAMAQIHLGHEDLGPNGIFRSETAEMPWVGGYATASDIFRFAEMLRRGGELDGARVLSPAILNAATTNRTGDKPNELYKQLAMERGWEPYPAYLGLGFELRGEAICHHMFGTLTSPRTFGNYGAGSSVFWVDPERDMTFVCLSTGVMNEGDNIERFEHLSDIAISAAI